MNEWSPRALLAAFACMVGCGLSNGPILLATFGQFVGPVSAGQGWSHTTFAVSLSVVTIATMVTYPFVGGIVDRFGARRAGIFGALVFGAMIVALAFVPGTNPFAFYAVFALAGFGSAFPSTVLFSRVVATWFSRHRGLMLGLTTGLGAALGFTLIPVLNLELLTFGWRFAYGALGVLVIVVEVPVLLFALHEGPIGSAQDEARALAEAEGAAPVRHWTLREAVSGPRLWLLLLAVSLGAGPLTALLSHMFPVVQEQGFSNGTAVAVMTIFAFTSPSWMIVLGAIVDRTGTPRLAALPLAGAALGGVLFITAKSKAVLYLGAGLLGMGNGTEYALLPLCVSRYFGVRHYGVIFGVCFAILQMVSGTSPLVFAASYDATGNYASSVHIAVACLLVCTVTMLFLPGWRPVRRRGGAVGPGVDLSADPSAPREAYGR